MIEAYNSVYNYDLKGIVETHLDSTADESKLVLNGYTFLRSNHPQDLKRGGIGLYVKDTFPARNRLDLAALHECIVCEVQINRRKYFLIVLYRSPSQTSSEFGIFMTNFEIVLSKVSAEDPYAVNITGDFNCRSTKWWQGDTDNEEGKIFEPFTSDLGLHQLISEPTHIMGDSKSCIDVIFTDQPNLFLQSGVHPSLQEQCHHQVVHGELCLTNPIPPPYHRRIWFYNRADSHAIQESIQIFNWCRHIGHLNCPNQQVEILTETLLNIFSNFIPNKTITVRPRQAPWITQSIKNFILKKDRAYKKFVRNGRPNDKLAAMNSMISQSSKLIEDAKARYLEKVGTTLGRPTTGVKTYWSLLKSILNKTRVPNIHLF